jgi:hypothetical protein
VLEAEHNKIAFLPEEIANCKVGGVINNERWTNIESTKTQNRREGRVKSPHDVLGFVRLPF